jgi:ribosomal-protein-alanine N-acetyltransferase
MNLRIFEAFPVLTTPRLVLRQPVPGDAPALLALYREEAVNRFQLQDGPRTHDAARALVTRWRKRFALRAGIRWAVTTREGGALLGTCAFTQIVAALDRGHLTYELTERAWGRGLGTEIVGAMVAFGHGEAALHRLEALVLPGNDASERVLQKSGFEAEGLLRAYGFWKGKHHDLRMFSRLRAGDGSPPAGGV